MNRSMDGWIGWMDGQMIGWLIHLLLWAASFISKIYDQVVLNVWTTDTASWPKDAFSNLISNHSSTTSLNKVKFVSIIRVIVSLTNLVQSALVSIFWENKRRVCNAGTRRVLTMYGRLVSSNFLQVWLDIIGHLRNYSNYFLNVSLKICYIWYYY